MNKLKKLIYIFIFCLFICINSVSVYADTSNLYTYESKYRGVVEGGYVKYGHLIISSNTNINVIYCMLDVGWTYRYIPIIYSKEPASVSVNVKGNHSSGTTIEQANNLSDYYNITHNLTSVQLTDLAGNPSYYIYNTWQDAFMEYYTNKFIEFETSDTPKFYYFEENADLKSQDTFIKALNVYLGGGYSDFVVSGGNMEQIKSTQYDLELPLNVSIKNTEWHGKTPKKVKITWEQSSDVDVKGWETEIYVQQKGTTGKYIWSVVNQKEFCTPYFFDGTVGNFEGVYNCNILDYKKTTEYIEELRGYSPQLSTIEKTNFMLRNKYMDGNVLHYSDFVYMKDDGEGNYIGNVVKSEEFNDKYTVDENGFISDLTDDSQLSEIIDTNNEYYQNDNLNNNGVSMDDFSIKDTIGNFSGFLGELPGLIADVVSYMPAAFTTLIILGVGVVIALRVLGR